ncbi:HAD family hydrolase [Piscirickettsia litoralis]|uniref:HAD hydrolase-like protein n=1 Tax=Piscirickettsia litoralis TaxID=1891921 RepID=UPI0013012E91|nr:HAD hydrolase-like protein [Piscirickettsia litoralis]
MFDLGGVIEKIYPSRVVKSFDGLGMDKPENLFTIYGQSEICNKFETGSIEEKEFIESVRGVFNIDASDDEIIAAWNSNQGGVSSETFNTLVDLKKNDFSLSVLSNTNPTHFKLIQNQFFRNHGVHMNYMFDNIILSYEVGLRKPEGEIFSLAKETIADKDDKILFIDDLKDNCVSAEACNMSVMPHVTNEELIADKVIQHAHAVSF